LTRTRATALDAADSDRSDVARVVERTDLHLKGTIEGYRGRRHGVDDHLEQRVHVRFVAIGFAARVTQCRRGIDDRKIQLFVGRAETIEQIESLVENPVGPRAVAINLVNDDDRAQTARERFLRDEPGLRHWPVDGIDQQEDGVDHRQNTFHFTAKVSMPRRVDDIDAVIAPVDRGILRQDGDPAFTFEVVAVKDALRAFRAAGEGSRLLQ
jgi:hypothetical protein